MRTLIVLCAGGQQIDGKPLILCRHPEGGIIAERILKGIYAESYDRIVFSVLSEEDRAFGCAMQLQQCLAASYPIEVALLPCVSDGPAESVIQTIELAGIKGEIAIRDSLGDMRLSAVPSGNFIAGLNMLNYGDSIQRMKSKGFVLVNEQNIVLDFVEKRFNSDIISVGLYGFKSAEQFQRSYRKLIAAPYPIQRLSVGHIISHMIGYYEKKFHLYFSEQFEDWGDPVAWYALQKRHATLFIDLDELLEGNGLEALDARYGDSFIKLSQRGAHCVFYCSDSRNYSYQQLQDYCSYKGIRCEEILCRQSFSTEKYLVNSAADIEKLMLGL